MAAQFLRYSSGITDGHVINRNQSTRFPPVGRLPSPPKRPFPFHLRTSSTYHTLELSGSGGDGGRSGNGSGGSGRGGGGGGEDDASSNQSDLGPLGFFLSGWRSRVSADPEFPFKVLMEEIVGVSSCVLGDMASRPNWGLNELDFVFSTLVVGSILNFTLMYLLAPTATSTAAAAAAALPGIFGKSPVGHMFEAGSYSLVQRAGTLVYKGAVFGVVGFAAGLVGTAISNGLIGLRKKMDPAFEPPNKPPPTLLNALTWATHMGVSSNVRYQTLNGLEFLLAKVMPPAIFKTNVVILRCLNNVLGGMSFVLLARMTGSQNSANKDNLVQPVSDAVEDDEVQGGEAQRIASSK